MYELAAEDEEEEEEEHDDDYDDDYSHSSAVSISANNVLQTFVMLYLCQYVTYLLSLQLVGFWHTLDCCWYGLQ